MSVPNLSIKDQGISYSEWVVGEYHGNMISPYRIVRALKDSTQKVKWECADGQGENEDLFDIPEPDAWHILDVRGK
jgi:hypothetical protein